MEKKEARFKLIANVGDIGLLTILARSRARLVVSALLASGALLGATAWVARYVNEASASVSLNLVLITGTMLFLLVASYVEAMLIGDLFFPGRWREQVLLGRKLDLEAQGEEGMAQHRDFNLHFLLVLAVLIVANVYGTRALTGDYLGEYHAVGFHLTRLRSAEVAEKEAALRDLSKTTYRERWHQASVRGAVLAELDAPVPELQRWAIFIAGQARYDVAFDRLAALAAQGDPQTRGEAAEALGMTQDSRAVPTLLGLLAPTEGDARVRLGALRGLGLLALRGADAGPRLLEIAQTTTDDTERATAAWALGQVRYAPGYAALWALFDKEASPGVRCAALEGLKYLAQHASDDDDVRRAKDRFADLPDHECPYLIWEDRNEEKIYVMFKEHYRTKLLKIVANRAGAAERDWFLFVASDTALPYPVRVQASDLVRLLK